MLRVGGEEVIGLIDERDNKIKRIRVIGKDIVERDEWNRKGFIRKEVDIGRKLKNKGKMIIDSEDKWIKDEWGVDLFGGKGR